MTLVMQFGKKARVGLALAFFSMGAFAQDPATDRLRQSLVDLEAAVKSDQRSVEARVKDVENALKELRLRASGDSADLAKRVLLLEQAWSALRLRVEHLEAGTEADRRAITDLRHQVATLSRPAAPAASPGRRVVIPMGSAIQGGVQGDDVVIGMGSVIQGGITARRLWVEDGAVVQGWVQTDELYAAASATFSHTPVVRKSTAAPPTAARANSHDRYLVIAYSPQANAPKAWRAWDYNDYASAEAAALNGCRGSGGAKCQVATWSRNACTALAVGANDRSIFGADWDREQTGRANAEARALKICQERAFGHGSCVIETSVCPGDKRN